MDPSEYTLMFRMEGSHWWYLGMRSITVSILNRFYQNRSGLRILDAGCGTGAAMTTYLREYGFVVGVDLSTNALQFCRQRNADLLGQASVMDLPFAGSCFDLLASFDVLYEDSVPDDLAAIREFSRVLVRGGRVLLRLPAYDWLRGQHDRIIHTARRYHKAQIRSLLQAAGFYVEHISYANMILFPIALLKRTAERFLGRHQPVSDLAFPAGVVNKLLGRLLSLEAPLVTRYGLPYGLSVIALGRRT